MRLWLRRPGLPHCPLILAAAAAAAAAALIVVVIVVAVVIVRGGGGIIAIIISSTYMQTCTAKCGMEWDLAAADELGAEIADRLLLSVTFGLKHAHLPPCEALSTVAADRWVAQATTGLGKRVV